jgi:hypothetical protein
MQEQVPRRRDLIVEIHNSTETHENETSRRLSRGQQSRRAHHRVPPPVRRSRRTQTGGSTGRAGRFREAEIQLQRDLDLRDDARGMRRMLGAGASVVVLVLTLAGGSALGSPIVPTCLAGDFCATFTLDVPPLPAQAQPGSTTAPAAFDEGSGTVTSTSPPGRLHIHLRNPKRGVLEVLRLADVPI